MFPEALHPWITGGLVLAMISALASGRFGPDIVFIGGLAALVFSGVLEAGDAVAGFAQPAVVTVGLLYVVSSGMKQTGATTALTSVLLGRPKSVRATQARLSAAVATTSAFVNNTPIVSMFLPVLSGFAKRNRLPVSQLYMPLSFASILGGVCTLIGTSTNIVVADLLADATALAPPDAAAAGPPVPGSAGSTLGLGMFTLAAVGAPIAVAGIVYIVIFGRLLLPRGEPTRDPRAAPAEDAVDTERRQYSTTMKVAAGSPIIGKTIEAAGLRHLPGLFLSRIDRDGESVIAVRPEEKLRENDVLHFVGDLDSVVDLQQIRGLRPTVGKDGWAQARHNLAVVEAVVSPQSRFLGQTIRDSGIRSRYHAVVIAVHRRGLRVAGKIGDIRLQTGDTLLLEAEPGFAERYRDSRDFYLITDRSSSAAPRRNRAWVAGVILLGLIVSISTGLLSALAAALVAACLMILTRCCTGPQARAGVDWQVLVTIAAAFGIGKAMADSGLAGSIASVITQASAGVGPTALLAAVYILTLVFTMLMTNNAAAVLMFPIALSIAASEGLNPLPFAIVIAVAASCEFSTPIGYQTNLMVMGPGGYRWLDYTRFGLPLTVLAAVICVTLTPIVFGPLEADGAALPAEITPASQSE